MRRFTVNMAVAVRLVLILLVGGVFCVGRVMADESTNAPVPAKRPEEIKFKHSSFTFARVKYSDHGRRGVSWSTDYPDSDLNFSRRFQQVTGLKTDPEGKIVSLTDPELKKHPFIYVAEGGAMNLSDEEVAGLRQYLLGGGFLMMDDFWGETEWENVRAEIKRVFPDREPTELPIEHPIFHCFYDIREKPQVPNFALGEQSQFTGVTWERADAKEPHYRGLVDDNGRLMAVLCHNTDLGDGWERESESAYFFREFSLKKAFPLGINIVVYALSR